jgi:predicted TIM-barrel fold metal-dependent hydrolase
VAGYDIHQHLWPPGFVAALRAREAPPRLGAGMLHCSEGDYVVDVAAHDLDRRLELMDRSGIDTAVVSLQPTLGIEQLPPAERDELVSVWEDGVLELAAAAPGRILALAAGRPREGFVGVSVGADRFDDLDPLAPTLGALRGSGFLFVHPVAGSSPLGLPAWWQAAVDYTSQMQRAYLSWLAHGQDRWPDVRIVFAILAGGAPIQLERLTSRDFDVRSLLHRNLYFDTASYGRRALELSIQTYGVEQLVFGSDVPVVDPAHAVGALEGFGASVSRLVREDNVTALLSRQASGGY